MQRQRGSSPILFRLLGGFEELDRIAVGILDLDLPAARTGLHLITQPHPVFRQRVYEGRKISDAQDHSIPSAGFLRLTAGHGPRSRCAWPAEQQHVFPERDARERRKLLMLQLEAKMVRIEGDRAGDILHLVAHAMHGNNAFVHHNLLGLPRISGTTWRARMQPWRVESKLSGPRTEKRTGA